MCILGRIAHRILNNSFLHTASPAYGRSVPAGNALDSPKPFHSQAPLAAKQEKTPPTGSILNLNLGESLIRDRTFVVMLHNGYSL